MPQPDTAPRRAAAAWSAIRAVALGCPLLASGCALVTGAPPSVEVLSVRLVGLGLLEQQLATTLCVFNPNRSEIAFRRVSVILDVAGAPIAEGASDLPVRLPPLSATAVPFTAVTTLRNLGPQLLGVLNGGGVEYRLHGTVSLAGGLGLSVPFSRSGRLDPVADGLDLAMAAADPAPSRCASNGSASN